MVTQSLEHSIFPPDRKPVYTNWARTALEVAVELEGLRGSTVMLPAFICQDSFLPLFERLDLTPRFVDVTLPTYHIDIEEAQEHIDAVDAVVVVHAFGLPVEMDQWVTLCDEHDCVLIEDCARALGARIDGQPVGAYGDYAVYSLQKVAPVSKGGVVLLPDSEADVPLQRPTYGVGALYNALPRGVREKLSVAYPLEIQPLSLDAITKRRFQRYAKRQYGDEMSVNIERARKLREGLEPLGFEFQEERAGRIYPVAPAMVPCKRDALIHYLMSYHVPHKVAWGNPWTKTHVGATFAEQYPNTADLSDRIIQFKVGAMDDDDVEFAIDRIREFVVEFGVENRNEVRGEVK